MSTAIRPPHDDRPVGEYQMRRSRLATRTITTAWVILIFDILMWIYVPRALQDGRPFVLWCAIGVAIVGLVALAYGWSVRHKVDKGE
jgi:hypothetical protein